MKKIILILHIFFLISCNKENPSEIKKPNEGQTDSTIFFTTLSKYIDNYIHESPLDLDTFIHISNESQWNQFKIQYNNSIKNFRLSIDDYKNELKDSIIDFNQNDVLILKSRYKEHTCIFIPIKNIYSSNNIIYITYDNYAFEDCFDSYIPSKSYHIVKTPKLKNNIHLKPE